MFRASRLLARKRSIPDCYRIKIIRRQSIRPVIKADELDHEVLDPKS